MMSGLDYSTFSLSSALTPSQPPSTRSYPADPIQQHVAEDVIDSHICNMQRDDLPSSIEMTDRPREGASILSGPYHGQGYIPSRVSLRSDSADDIQGNMLCAQFGEIHFTPQYGGHGHATVDEPTAIIENPYVRPSVEPEPYLLRDVRGGSSWGSHHTLHYPTPVCGFVAQCSKGAVAGTIPEDARPGVTMPHSDVSPRVPARRPSMSMAMTDRRGYDFGLVTSPPLPSMAMDVTPFLPGGAITSPSPPPTMAYHDDDYLGADCAHALTYVERFPMTHTTAHESAAHYECHTVHSLGGFHDAPHPGIISLDHRYATAMATPFPGYSSSQSPHDHPICEPPSFGTAIHAEELPRPGSAPPLIDNQVPFVGDVRAALLQPPQDTASGDHVNRPHAWYPQPAAPGTGQSPRSCPRRVGSISHTSQKTPLGSRHLRRWSSVTNPALRASPPFPSSLSPNVVVPFPRYPPPPLSPDGTNPTVFAHLSPSAESESDDPACGYAVAAASHAAVVDVPEASPSCSTASSTTASFEQQQQQQQPPVRAVVLCDGVLIDEDSWSAALARPDKLVHVYECFWDLAHTPCGMWIEGEQSSVADHLALFHGFRGGEVATRCLWRDCPRPHMKGTSIARHVMTHVGFRVKCHTCRHEFARVDACNRAHSRSGCGGVGQPMYGDLQRVLDARKVDPLLRPSKKRRTDE